VGEVGDRAVAGGVLTGKPGLPGAGRWPTSAGDTPVDDDILFGFIDAGRK
jgi:hypothetical protein